MTASSDAQGLTTIIVLRHGERMDAVDKTWMSANTLRPFDPPLTERGGVMGFKAGEAIQQIIKEEGLPPVSRMFSSPLLRCVQTAAEVRKGVGFDGKINPEPALAEIIWEEWYRSWGVPGTDGEWGGPPHCGMGVPVATEDLHPACHREAGELYLTPEQLKEQFGEVVAGDEYTPNVPASSLKYRWGTIETVEESKLRVGKFAEACAEKHPGETMVMCSHGGPTSLMYQHLSNSSEDVHTGYTAIFVYVKEADGWRIVTRANTAHLGDVDAVQLGLQYAPRS